MPGTKQKPIAFSYEGIKRRILAVGNKMDRFMFAVSYANGTRVSEILNLCANDIDIDEEFIYIQTPVRKKRRNDVYRAPPISRKGEPWLAYIISNYVKDYEGELSEYVLITYSKRTAQRRFEEFFDCTSHSFRHTRVTHCFTVLGMSERLIAEYFRISPSSLGDWIMRYGHLNRKDLKAHLKQNFAKEEIKT